MFDKDKQEATPADGLTAASEMSLPNGGAGSAYASPRDFLDNRFVYVVESARAGGLSVGVNVNPDKGCNFDCVYCEVDRRTPSKDPVLDLKALSAELIKTLGLIYRGELQKMPRYLGLPSELLVLREVALSGDGEPTQSEQFPEALETVAHVRAQRLFPFFKMVLLTNCTGLDSPKVQKAFKLFTSQDEIWMKLEAGTQEFMDRVNRPRPAFPLEKVLSNILLVAKHRPVVIQSLFPLIDGEEPAENEIQEYVNRLKYLKDNGANISLVQIYSATRPMANAHCGHLPLRALSAIARSIRASTGLRAEVF
jgi:wyosine [tRNA(Phe)-imidazoG37] synthetase (radical SAM superfamily)